MVDRPIIFSAPMVRALLDGRKTQTRRVLKRTDLMKWDGKEMRPIPVGYAPGDRLYVRESVVRQETDQGVGFQTYAADGSTVWPLTEWYQKRKSIPSIHMHRWASRLTLTVTDVRVQRLQEISEADAVAEGIEADEFGAWHCYQAEPKGQTFWACPRESFRTLWNSLHVPDAWGANPWVVAVSFTVQRGNIDQIGGAA